MFCTCNEDRFNMHDIWLVTIFLKKVIISDAIRCLDFSKNAYGSWAPPGPAGGAHSALPEPLAWFRGPTSKGKGGLNVPNFVSRSPCIPRFTYWVKFWLNLWCHHRISVFTFSNLIVGSNTDVCPGRQTPSCRHCQGMVLKNSLFAEDTEHMKLLHK